MTNAIDLVNNKILAEMEKGNIPWLKPWGCGKAVSHSTGKRYSLLNQFLLDLKGGEWATFNEITKNGGKVKKGAKAHFVVFWTFLEKPLTDADGNKVVDENGKQCMKQIPMLRYYYVFKIGEDTEDIEPKYVSDEKNLSDSDKVESAETAITAYTERENIEVKFGGNEAYYSVSGDYVKVPEKTSFSKLPEYYSTIFHELTHSTGAEKRLNRFKENDSNDIFGSEKYSKEELVAEIGAASILSILGIETHDSIRNSAAYLQSWLKALKNDKNMLVSAAGKADKAVSMILGE